MIATINTYNNSIIICAVYRPPPSQRNGLSTAAFMTEWCQFMSELTTNNPELVFVGDINIHLDNTSLCHTQNFMKSLEATGLQQHIQEPTHYIGHTLDVLISRDDSTMLSNISVVDIGLCNKEGKLTRDHYATVFSIIIAR